MSWLWKSDTSSTASFEKALSKLSTQISAADVALQSTRSRGRRIKALWTLYTTLTYLVYILLLVLVVGPQYWSTPHYGGLVGIPITIYGIRVLITSVVNWRANRQQIYLSHLQKQREEKIRDLKKATKYDSTQELLQKYGATPPPRAQPESSTPQVSKKKPQTPQSQPQRTGIAPPATANIPGRQPVITPQSNPTPRSGSARPGLASHAALLASPIMPDEPGFAPNAFSQPTQVSHGHAGNWYDRILDVLLGEDETLAKNRVVLLCQNCRVVNGQAPPGVKTLEELGKWRCATCGAWNGQESETAKAVKEMAQKPDAVDNGDWEKVSRGDEAPEHVIESPRQPIEEDASEGSGREQTGSDSAVSRRVTRSTGVDPVEGL